MDGGVTGRTNAMIARSIPPKLYPHIREQSAAGKTTKQIADWLGVEHGVKTTYRSVARILEKDRAERAPIAREVVRKALEKTVVTDVDRLERVARQASTKATKIAAKALLDPAWMRAWVAVKELELRAVDRRLHYSGADAENPQTVVVASAAEARRVMREAFREVAVAEAAGDADRPGTSDASEGPSVH